MKIKYLFASFFFALSCATPVSHQGRDVRVVKDIQFVEGCDHVTSVDSSSSWGGFAATGVAYTSAMNQLKNQAADAGANVILISTLSNTMGGTNMSGEAFNCISSQFQGQEESGGERQALPPKGWQHNL